MSEIGALRMMPFAGLPIVTNINLVKTVIKVKRWRRPGRPLCPPKVRHKIWHKPDPTIYQINGRFMMHPAIFERLRRELNENEVNMGTTRADFDDVHNGGLSPYEVGMLRRAIRNSENEPIHIKCAEECPFRSMPLNDLRPTCGYYWIINRETLFCDVPSMLPLKCPLHAGAIILFT